MENKDVQTEVVEKDYIVKSKFSVGGLIWSRIIVPIIGIALLSFVTGFLMVIPVIGWIIGLVIGLLTFFLGLSMFIDLIQFLFVHVKLTETGIVGTGDYWKHIELSYDQISMLESYKKTLIIHTNIPKNSKGTKMKKYKVCNIANFNEFLTAYNAEAAKIAAAKVAAENASTEA